MFARDREVKALSAELVIVEPGAAAAGALRASTDQNHVMVLASDEPMQGFESRVQQRISAIRRSRQISCVTYLVGELSTASWSDRQRLLRELCQALAPQGTVAVYAPARASTEVLGCVGDLQLSSHAGLEWRAVFTQDEEQGDAAAAATDDMEAGEFLMQAAPEVEERSGVRYARPVPPEDYAQTGS